MEYRKLGQSGLNVSVVGLGCNNFAARCDLAQSRAVVHAALDAGINFLDTADVYGNRGGSESQLGEILGPRRKDVILATKFGRPMDDAGTLKGTSAAYVVKAIDASLKRLRTDWIDLYQIHWPNPDTPLEETMRALDALVSQGKVRAVGASNLAAWQVTDASWIAKANGLSPFVSIQNEYSLLHRSPEREVIPAMMQSGACFLPYYPLASGMLSGKYRRGALPEGSRLATPRPHEQRFIAGVNWPLIEMLDGFCATRGRSMLELAFGWLAAQPVVASIIAGATRPEQVVQNVAAISWRLTPHDLAEINAMTGPRERA